MIRSVFAALCAVLVFIAPATAEGFYASAFGGANMHDAFGGEGEKASLRLDHDTGYTAGVALGSRVAAVPGLRAELELSWRTNGHKGLFDACEDVALGGHDSTFAAMANVAYGKEAGRFRPYVLIGAGYSARRISIDPAPSNFAANGFGTERQGFAWQTGVGVDMGVADGVSVGIAYRYFSGIAINRNVTFDGHDAFMTANGDSHAVMASVTIALD